MNAGRPLGLAPILFQPTNQFGEYLNIIVMPVVPAAIRAPADMIAFGDAVTVDEWFRYANAKFVEAPWMEKLGWRVADVYSQGANVAFCDGHVEYAKRSKWVEETVTARRRWNNDHEPHPETW